MSKVIVTGGAGFIGSHLVDKLIKESHDVLVVDNFDSFYPREIKEKNIEFHNHKVNYKLIETDIRDREHVFQIFDTFQPDTVVHLAAKAGVRPSVENPKDYVDVNINGTTNILDASVKNEVSKFIFGSSSSVYGLNDKVPFSESDPLWKPASPYGATKLAGEALCNSYNNCYGIPIAALRFFTVYGPRQRPDLAIHKFAKRIINNEPIQLYGDGTSSRDYTFVSDIVQGIRKAMERKHEGYEVFNLGNDHPTKLLDLVQSLEKVIGKEAKIEWQSNQIGDVPRTWADLRKSKQQLGYRANVLLENGLEDFIHWFREGSSIFWESVI